MPKRGAVALVTTVFALILLLSFKTPTDSLPLTGGGGSVAAIERSASPPPATARPFGPGQGNAGGFGPDGGATTGDGGAGRQPATGGGPAAGGPAATASPRATARPGAAPAGSYDGPVVQTQFGPVQVRVTIAGGKISDVQALQLPFDRRRSAQISQYVEPILRSSVLSAQSTNVDIISGATYTSYAYLQSLQAALDAARG
jgi:uncharacterized protein with FMN-binding domain